MRRLRRRLDRLLIRVLARRRSPVEAIRDVDYVREILRFSLLFSTLVLIPVSGLAMLALRSLETEEISIDAGLATRAGAIATGVEDTLSGTFATFEADVLRRIDAGETSFSTLYELMPALKGVYRFDTDGRLTAPFTLPTPEDAWPAPHPRFQRAERQAQSLEREGRFANAVVSWSLAASSAEHVAHQATASFGRARAMERAGWGDRAAAAYVDVASEYPTARDHNGFRVADLCELRRADLLERADKIEDALAVWKTLVERSLGTPWAVGYPGEAFVAREALARLEGRSDASWHRFATSTLGTLARQLQWASYVEDELALLGSRIQGDTQFHYYPEENALWSTVTRNNTVWAFSFDYDGLKSRLANTVIDIANSVDPDLAAALVPAGEELGVPLARRSLAPRMPRAEIVVRPMDPTALAEQRRDTRQQRRLVIFFAVASSLFGIGAAVRVVNRQLDVARAKADFAANVSHELRSPLTQIRLKGESLQLDLVFDDEDRQAHYDDIVREAERLSRLVDNVLDFAAIERGQKSYLRRPEDLGEILYKALEASRPAAEAANLELTLDLPDDLPVLWLDREAISQVVVNLLSNAVKYGATGDRIDIHAESKGDEVEFSVQDYGIGIPQKDQGHVFEQFYRVHSTEVRKRRGTGIGLTIVRYIVEAHDGTIGVTSEPGSGSTFTVSLPVEPPKDAGG